MGVVGIGSQKTVERGRVKDNQIKERGEKRGQNKSAKDKNRRAKLKQSSTERFILVCNLCILYVRF